MNGPISDNYKLSLSGQLSVTAKCVQLEQRTELVVSRKVRHHRSSVPCDGQTDDRVTSTERNIEDVSIRDDDSLDAESCGEKQESLVKQCFNYIKSFYSSGDASTGRQVEPPTVDPFIDRLYPGCMSGGFEMTLRVQAIDETDCIVEGHSLSRQPDGESDGEEKHKFVWQTANVRIGIETIAQYCDIEFDHRAMRMFAAVLQKIPSPSEKAVAAKERLNHTATKRKETEATRNKMDAHPNNDDPETKVVVRVLIVDMDNSCEAIAGNALVVFNTRPLVGHIMISELLRRQIGAGVTSKVRLVPLNCDPIEVNGVELCPLFKTVSTTDIMHSPNINMLCI